jgi:hypothetical protein
MTPCSPELYPKFRRKVSPRKTVFRRASILLATLLARWFAEIFFDPEDGGDTFLRNVENSSTDYTASYPRR